MCIRDSLRTAQSEMAALLLEREELQEELANLEFEYMMDLAPSKPPSVVRLCECKDEDYEGYHVRLFVGDYEYCVEEGNEAEEKLTLRAPDGPKRRGRTLECSVKTNMAACHLKLKEGKKCKDACLEVLEHAPRAD